MRLKVSHIMHIDFYVLLLVEHNDMYAKITLVLKSTT